MSLRDKAIIVTGGSGAIGRAFAHVAAREGARLMLVSTNADRLEAAQKEIAADGGEVATFAADCSRWDQVEAYVSAAVERFGRIDGLFNNAAIEGKIAPLTKYPEDAWDRVVEVDLKGVFLGLRHVLPVMIEQGSGVIVNTGSVGSERGVPGGPAYNAAKHGLVGLTRQAAVEAGRQGVRVNAVFPGFVDSPLLRKILTTMMPDADLDHAVEQLGAIPPIGRCAQPEEIGEVVAFLMSDRASYVNGVGLPVDGGLLAALPGA
jgi:NAD(P)-dependent dehydrogenase (short-subunit alcohol dehydrogenase family)